MFIGANMEKTLKATTYNVVAKGVCIGCKRYMPLNFVWNPYDDDDLMCEDCSNEVIEYYRDNRSLN